ncbi:DUF6518 family protein [Herbidospora sp. NBRC 101105]|uniref:DUF6518 family protein n=1 Tax=Herbidospora sp. NBRC 101105 TaxID=3032195 RepID=UPI0024A4065D|nr:DUF6518 family protein [Herbidospora sp. NBRC 101105]GLX94506.1 hypothetical protein Hesp01_24560 [Herbidospora sp. NBRC 101105]
MRWWRAAVTALVAGLVLGVLTNLAQGWLPGAWNNLANSGAVWSVAAFVAGALVAGGLPREFTMYGPGVEAAYRDPGQGLTSAGPEAEGEDPGLTSVGPEARGRGRGFDRPGRGPEAWEEDSGGRRFEAGSDAGFGAEASPYGAGVTPAELLRLVPPAPSALPRALFAGLAVEVGLVAGYYGFAEFGRGGMGDLFWPLVWVVVACVAGPVFGVAGSWWRRGVARWQRVGGLAALAGVFGMEGVHYAFGLGYAPQAWACLVVFLLVPLLAHAVREIGLTLLAAVPLVGVAYLVVILPLRSLSG